MIRQKRARCTQRVAGEKGGARRRRLLPGSANEACESFSRARSKTPCICELYWFWRAKWKAVRFMRPTGELIEGGWGSHGSPGGVMVGS